MKETIFKSVTAILCVVAICITMASVAGNYADNLKAIAELTPAANVGDVSTNGGDATVDGDDAAVLGDDTAVPGDDTAVPGDDATLTDDGTATPGDTNASTGGNSATTPNSGAAANSNDPTKYTPAQVASYYVSCLQNSYKQKVSISREEKTTIIVDEVNPGGKLITSVANKIVESYAKTYTDTQSFTGTSKNGQGWDIDNFAFKTTVEPASVKTASVKKTSTGYDITMTIVSEKATLSTPPKYNSKCAYPLDLSTIDLFGLEITQADFTYAGTVIKATVDAKGRITSASVNMPLEGVGAGKLGLTLTAKVHGSYYRTAKFAY